ncbi:YciI family protein [Pacificibacter marinus]|uniref:YCII-related domain protein n=1 Tax=Pacificibacter marinus TaxID=658057 RepID=A0A1Y5RXB4_9RHOB|nr:YciI family protein [Pacificibacter marinus]SEK41557.1 Uncharacterized conserved protein YciI, contains a putative active-site phosphohistidine [Pacificibacter marinus]SLN24708.1 YCII-related domain protein [Pacificibacter marinus]
MSIIPADQNLFYVDIEYKVALDQVAPYLEAHLAFVDEGYARGFFLASGPKVPRSGGSILATAPERGLLEEFLARDPFVTHGLITLILTEFTPRRTVAGL